MYFYLMFASRKLCLLAGANIYATRSNQKMLKMIYSVSAWRFIAARALQVEILRSEIKRQGNPP